MKIQFISFIAGLLFSTGLVISGMTNPNIVIGFLDIFGDWNYSLMFVMIGAVVFNFFSFKIILKKTPLLTSAYLIPTRKDIDSNLILGAAIFGVGWGLLGVCPGPGIVNIALATKEIILFIFAILMGILVHQLIFKGIRGEK